jgi:hypothetical protein
MLKFSPNINLFMNHDIFDPKYSFELILKGANTIIKTNAYMFVTHVSETTNLVTAWSSTYKSGFKALKKVHLPDGELNLGHDFTVLDTKEE